MIVTPVPSCNQNDRQDKRDCRSHTTREPPPQAFILQAHQTLPTNCRSYKFAHGNAFLLSSAYKLPLLTQHHHSFHISIDGSLMPHSAIQYQRIYQTTKLQKL
jgi:hypothetical protein